MTNEEKINAYLQQLTQRIYNVHQRLAPLVGAEVINHTLDNFKNQSFDGQKWPRRKDKKNTKPLLVKSGRLRRGSSWRVLSSSPTRVTVGTDVPYARIHNDGGTIQRAARSETFVRNRYRRGPKARMFGGMGAFQRGTTPGRGQTYKAYNISMPQRRFLGISKKLASDIKALIKEEYDKEFPKTK